MSQPRVYNITTPDHMLSLAELHETAVAFAEELFSRKGQVPFLWILDLGHEILWMETPWEDDTEKTACLKIITIIMREAKVRAYVNMVEAWTASYRGVHPDDEGFKMPSELPPDQRDDILMISSFDKKSDEQLITRYLVTVRKRGQLNFLGPRDDLDLKKEGGHFEGRMFNLLKNTSTCQGCGLSIGHKTGCMAPLVAKMFTAGKV